MNEVLTKLFIKEVEELLNRVKNGNCALDDDEMIGILSTISHRKLKKLQACDYLKISRATFDNLVAAGRLQKGKKIKRENGLIWYQDELVIK